MLLLLRIRSHLLLPSTRHTPFLERRSRRMHALSLIPALLRDATTTIHDVTFVEEPVYFFEGEVGGFGVAEVLESSDDVRVGSV